MYYMTCEYHAMIDECFIFMMNMLSVLLKQVICELTFCMFVDKIAYNLTTSLKCANT